MARNLQHRADNSDSYTRPSVPASSNTHTFTFTKPANINPATLQDPTVSATVSFDPWGPVLSAKVLPPADSAAAGVSEPPASSSSSSAASDASTFSDRGSSSGDARSLQGGSEEGRAAESRGGKWTVTIENMPKSNAMVSPVLLASRTCLDVVSTPRRSGQLALSRACCWGDRANKTRLD